MGRKTIREHSRIDWSINTEEYPGDMTISIGCLQRIADATEKMASNYVQLQNERDYFERRVRALEQELRDVTNSRAGYKAALTKLRKGTAKQHVTSWTR